jgi:hypothetical protein
MAEDLEFRQQQRYRQTKKYKDTFFERPNEKDIQDKIKMLRQLSETYSPDNAR